MLSAFINKVKDDIINTDYNSSLQSLNEEIELYKADFLSITGKLSKIKEKMISYRNQKEELSQQIKELSSSQTDFIHSIKKIHKNHLCPICNSEIDDDLSLKLKMTDYNSLEDIILLMAACQKNINELERKISNEEKNYQEQLLNLEEYQKSFKSKNVEVDKIIEQQGVIAIREKFICQLGMAQAGLSSNEKKLKELKKALRSYQEIKKDVNEKYYQLILADKTTFDIQEILDSSLKNINSNYHGQGSNRTIATIIWIYSLLRLKREFNPESIKFPIVLDAPTDTELDDDKRELFIKYIFNNKPDSSQLIVSILGFDINTRKDLPVDKIISIDTPKYKMLLEDDYEKYKHLLLEYTKEH